MFKPVPMQLIRLMILRRDERAVMRALGELGLLELRHSEPIAAEKTGGGTGTELELVRCEKMLARATELRRALDLSAPPTEALDRIEPEPNELERKIARWERNATALLQGREAIARRLAALNADMEGIADYRDLDLPLAGADEFSFLHFVTGSLPSENLATLERRAGTGVAVLPLAEQTGRRTVLAMTTRNCWPQLEATLAALRFEGHDLPASGRTSTREFWTENERERESLSRQHEQTRQAIGRLAQKIARPLAAAENSLLIHRQLLEAGQTCSHSESAALLTGWVSVRDMPALVSRLEAVTGGRHLLRTMSPEAVPREDVPVRLDERGWLKPFAMLVSAYGLPIYGEMVPTLWFALSYVLMFGAMFGDAGHGTVLLLAAAALFLWPRTRRWRQVAPLLGAGGLASIAFGVVYGSYFGLPQLRPLALWHDPLEGDSMTLMRAAMTLGVAMISLGIVLNILNHAQRGGWREALCGHFGLAGAVFYWSALALLMTPAGCESPVIPAVLAILLLGVPVGVWMLHEPLELLWRRSGPTPPGLQTTLFAVMAESAVGAFEAVLSFLANTISFVRLAAYAMSHAALLVAAFLLAQEVRQVPVVGDGLGVVVVVLGNVVAIALEGVIAAVQALRLEYYEFFGKFFSGEGKAFRPFRLGAEYRAAC